MRRSIAVLAACTALLLAGCGPRNPQSMNAVPQAAPAPQAPVQVTPPPAPPKSMPQSGASGSFGNTRSSSQGAPPNAGSFGAPRSGNTSATKALAKADPVFITRTGKKYHRGDCQHLAKGAAKMSRAQAQREGYTACDVCKP